MATVIDRRYKEGVNARPHIRVANPPSKPVLIWDGDCQFCARWIERWRAITGDDVEYVASQEIGERFPEVPREQFERSIVFVEKTGEVCFAAEAACRSLGGTPSKKWLPWSYDHVPGFATLSEFGYRLLASNRTIASRITRLVWGDAHRR